MVRVGHILASNVKYIFLGGIVYINIINDAAECTTEIFRSDSKKKIHTSLSTSVLYYYISRSFRVPSKQPEDSDSGELEK